MIEVSKKWLKDTIIQLESMDEEELKILSLLVKDELQRRDFYEKQESLGKTLASMDRQTTFFRVGRKTENHLKIMSLNLMKIQMTMETAIKVVTD